MIELAEKARQDAAAAAERRDSGTCQLKVVKIAARRRDSQTGNQWSGGYGYFLRHELRSASERKGNSRYRHKRDAAEWSVWTHCTAVRVSC
jgi:hypothetical protein